MRSLAVLRSKRTFRPFVESLSAVFGSGNQFSIRLTAAKLCVLAEKRKRRRYDADRPFISSLMCTEPCKHSANLPPSPIAPCYHNWWRKMMPWQHRLRWWASPLALAALIPGQAGPQLICQSSWDCPSSPFFFLDKLAEILQASARKPLWGKVRALALTQSDQSKHPKTAWVLQQDAPCASFWYNHSHHKPPVVKKTMLNSSDLTCLAPLATAFSSRTGGLKQSKKCFTRLTNQRHFFHPQLLHIRL